MSLTKTCMVLSHKSQGASSLQALSSLSSYLQSEAAKIVNLSSMKTLNLAHQSKVLGSQTLESRQPLSSSYRKNMTLLGALKSSHALEISTSNWTRLTTRTDASLKNCQEASEPRTSKRRKGAPSLSRTRTTSTWTTQR